MKIFFSAILLIGLFFGGYVYWNYYNVYSDGEREGVMMKISHKGNVFKTYEGEIVQPGLRTNVGVVNSNNFLFSTMDETVAKQLETATGKTVKIHYLQYRNSLPWRGENHNDDNKEEGQYVVDKLVQVKD